MFYIKPSLPHIRQYTRLLFLYANNSACGLFMGKPNDTWLNLNTSSHWKGSFTAVVP